MGKHFDWTHGRERLYNIEYRIRHDKPVDTDDIKWLVNVAWAARRVLNATYVLHTGEVDERGYQICDPKWSRVSIAAWKNLHGQLGKMKSGRLIQ